MCNGNVLRADVYHERQQQHVFIRVHNTEGRKSDEPVYNSATDDGHILLYQTKVSTRKTAVLLIFYVPRVQEFLSTFILCAHSAAGVY